MKKMTKKNKSGSSKTKMQAGGSVSKQGFRDDSPYRNASSLDIHTPTGQIDMSHTGIPLIANGRYLPPYSGMHRFAPGTVKEIPVAEIGLSQTGGGGGLQFGGNVLTYQGTGDIQREKPMKKKLTVAQNGTGLSGPVLRSGPNVKNSKGPNPKVTKAPSRGTFVNSTFPMQLGGHNWQTPTFAWGGNGMAVGPYQDGGQMPQGQDPNQQAPQQQGQQQDPQEQKLMQLMDHVEQALKQGASPKEVAKTLVKQGIPKKSADQLVQQVIAHSQQEQQPQQQGPPAQQGPQQMPQAKRGIRMAQSGGIETGITPLQTQQPQIGDFNKVPQNTGTLPLPPNPNETQAPGSQSVTQPISQRPPTMFNPVYTGNYYADRAIYSGNRAGQLNRQAGIDSQSTDPNVQHQAEGERRAAVGNNIISGTSGAQAVINGVETGVGIAGALFGNSQARKLEMEQQSLNNRRNRAIVKPYTGDNTAPAYAKDGYVIPYGTQEFAYGGRLPLYQAGGVPTEGSDFQSQNPNVMTEKGETIADPTKGPVGPDGRPTGVVVNDQTGDNHSDPSGGNAYNLGADAVVHSKVLGIKVGDFIAAAKDAPKGAYIVSKITEKYPNPNKEVSYAKLAALFDTKELAQEVDKIGAKVEDIEKKDQGNQATKVTQKTDELNKKTLARKLAMKKQEMATNTEIAGANGPIHGISEGLKASGAYGDKVQNEQQQAEQGNPPTTAGAGIKMKGKKLILPKAQSGAVVKHLNANRYNADVAQEAKTGYLPITPKGFGATGANDDQFNPVAPVTSGADNTSFGANPVTQQTVQPPTKVFPQPAGPLPSAITTDPADKSKYSQLPTPYSTNTGLNQTNLNKIYQQYGQRDKDNPGWYNDFAAQVEKGERIVPSTVGDWNAYGQKKHADGTFGDVTASDMIEMENQPGMGFMKGIANKYGLAHFDPGNNEYIEDPITGKMALKGQVMMRDYEEAVNKADKAQGAQPFFVEGVNTQPFGAKKFGNWHASVSPWVQPSVGGSSSREDFDPEMPVVYRQHSNATPAAVQNSVAKINPANVTTSEGPGKSIYREGLAPEQIAEDLGALFMRRDPVPYVEDQGAKDALAANTRQQYVNDWAARNAITRSAKAATQYNPQNTPSVTAQIASNAWTAQNELSSQTAKQNAEIQKRYEDQNVALREKAGSNKAVALDTLAKRTADVRWKQSALTLNSIGNIAKKRLENRLENRQAALYQGMFKNAAYDPTSGTYIADRTYTPSVGSPDYATQLAAAGYTPLDIYRIQHGQELLEKGQMEEQHGAEYARLHQTPYNTQSKKFGGKVKRIPARMKKSK